MGRSFEAVFEAEFASLHRYLARGTRWRRKRSGRAGLRAADGKRDPLADSLEHPVVAGHKHLVGTEDA